MSMDARADHHHPHTFADRPHPEFVVLDIGQDVGALIVHADAEMHAIEVEISPAGRDWDRSHKEVLERFIDDESAFTAVFDELPCGSYTLWVDGVARAREVHVQGGEVTSFSL